MSENNKTPPQLIPAAALQAIYRQHLGDTRRYHYYDREGRLAWSCKDWSVHYTWYLYDHEGQIMEMGEYYISAGTLGHVLTVYQCTTRQSADFIINMAGHNNVLRRTADPIAETVIPVLQTAQVSDVAIPAPSEKDTMKVSMPHPITNQQPEIITQQNTITHTEAQSALCNITFADEILAAIFASPVPDWAAPHPSKPQSKYVVQQTPICLFRYYYRSKREMDNSILHTPASSIRQYVPVRPRPSPVFTSSFANTS